MAIDATPPRGVLGRARRPTAALVLLACAALWGCASGNDGIPPGGGEDEAPGTPAGAGAGDVAADVVSSASPGEAAAPARPDGGTAWVIFGADTVVAEVAATADARTRGLQDRESIPPGTGMLFVYGERDVRSFWMVNTLVALDIAFLDTMAGRELEEEGRVPAGTYRVVDVQSMEPETSTLHTSAEPAVMALEVARGWFEAHGVEAGDTATVVWGR